MQWNVETDERSKRREKRSGDGGNGDQTGGGVSEGDQRAESELVLEKEEDQQVLSQRRRDGHKVKWKRRRTRR